MKINEVDPHNFDSDWDYYDALKRQGRKPEIDPEDELERRAANRPQTQADIEDEISQQRQAAHAKFTKKREVKYVNQEGSAPNGKKYNKLYVIHAQDEAVAAHEEYLFDKHEWGAKKVVDVEKSKNEDGTVTHTLFIVDNHKYGLWKPWKDSPVYKEGTEQGVAEGSDNVGASIKALYQKIYNAGDDEIEYFYNDSPIFAQYWDEYEGDLDSIIAEVDPGELQVILDELESYAQQAGLAEGEKSPMFKDSQKADRIRSLKNLIAIAQEQGRQLRVQELELELKKLQGVLDEKAPPGMEDWIKDRKADFKKRYGDKWQQVLYATAWKRHNNESVKESAEDNPVAGAITRRILMQRTDLLQKYGPVKVGQAIDDVADFVGDTDEIGSSDVSAWVKQVEQSLASMGESVKEASPRVDSLVTDALKIMRGSEMSDAVQALKTVLGDREFSSRRGHYNFYVRQLMDMYNKQGVTEAIHIDVDLVKAVFYVAKEIYDGAKAGSNMTDTIVDELGDYFDDVEQSGLPKLKKAYAAMRDTADADPNKQKRAAGDALLTLNTLIRQGTDRLKRQGMSEATDNPTDVICVDVPLFIRLMEYAREDASTDMDLHDVAERLIRLSAEGATVTMSSYDEIVGSQKEIKEADMDLEQGRQNILSILKAAEQGQDAEITVGGEPITLEYPEARFVGGRYKAFMKAGRQEEFLRALTDARAFDRIMSKMRAVLDKQKNFRGSIPGERGVEEAAPGLVTGAAGLTAGLVAAAGAPAIVGILGPLLGIPFAAYGAYSAAKLGMKGVEKLWDMASEKLGGDDKVEQYTQAKIAKLPPDQAQAAQAVIKQVAESRKSTAPKLQEEQTPEKELERLKLRQDSWKKAPLRDQAATQSRIRELEKQIKDKDTVDEALLSATARLKENEYFCMMDKQVKIIPEGYKRNKDGYLVRR